MNLKKIFMFRLDKDTYSPSELVTVEELPIGIYTFSYNRQKYHVEATYSGKSFKMPSRLYGVDRVFIKNVIKRFESGSKNMGILLNGYKGSGKSLTAKLICNEINLPILVLGEHLSGEDIQEFCLALTQDCVIFLDEYEKVFGSSDKLLSLMDGALNLPVKILFLLTSNELEINESMINRPSRIYYIKQFESISDELIEEILFDLLSDKSRMDAVKEMISEFQECTIDNVITFINEVNFADNDDLDDMLSLLNITRKERGAGFKVSSKKQK